jgi:hypothetical protein
MTQSANPLKQYFRQPAIYLQLPSLGEFWPEGSIDLPPNKQLPVLPMTAIDEITYRTPDALFNGQAVVNVIQSCVPNIKDAWAVPNSDINAILTAIRIASYGHEMEITTRCPSCTNVDDYSLDLRSVLEQIKMPDFKTQIKHGDLEIAFRPISYSAQNETNALQFDEQRILQMLPGSDMDEKEKMLKLNEALKKITAITVQALKHSISSIRTPQAIVSESEHIEEFLNNCDRALFTKIRDHVLNIRTESELKPLKIKCAECSSEYQQPLTLDMTSFFAAAS